MKLDFETAAVRMDRTIADHLSWRADRLKHAEEPEAGKLDDSVRRWLQDTPPLPHTAQCDRA